METFTKAALALGSLTIALTLGVGCGSCDADDTAGTSAGGDVEPRVIAVIPKGTTHEFWKSVHAGAIEAGRALGVEILWQGPLREDDRSEQVRVVEDMISRGVAGIVLAPLDDTALVPPAREAVTEGIPVAIIDSDLSWDGRVSFIATDNREGGRVAGRRLGELLEGHGKALMMRYQEGSASTNEREEGFLEVMRAEFPGIELVSTNQYGGATTETAYSTGENLLVGFPDVNGVFAPNESTTFGMLRALRDANKGGVIKLVGFDSSTSLVEGLEAGDVHGLVVQNPFRMGELGVRTMVAHLEGQEVEPRIDTGATLVTRENVSTPEIRQLLLPDLSPWLD
jgi:ribose transport system substrate-binding protein